ncbi:MAG: endonuclease/exonuclease/phosphatase family protein [Myxococcales bacterium]|nr:endonuclease/exonuclease/phosphatase family protein [Myxococcales bacterium]
MARARAGVLRWIASLVGISALLVLATHLLGAYLHEPLTREHAAVQTLRILTWNIGKIYLPLESRASDRDLGHVARVIRKSRAQVVALQEMRDPRQLGRLVAQLGSAWRGRIPEDRYDRRAALLTTLPVRFVELPTSTGRTAQGAELTLTVDGQPLRVTLVSLHLDAFDAERRTRQAEEILSSARRLQNAQLVVAGDFNFDPAGLSPDSSDQRLYTFLTRSMVDAGRSSGATTLVARRLDYVFYSRQHVARADARVLRGQRINLMDHDPLIVELSLEHGAAGAAGKRTP